MSDDLNIHTVKQYDGELHRLNVLLRDMATAVMGLVNRSMTAFEDPDLALAQSVIGDAARIDVFHQSIDDEVMSVLARRAPVAVDLRKVMSISKSAGDLAKIGDEAVRIAKTVIQHFRSGGQVLSGEVRRSAATLVGMAKSHTLSLVEVLEGHDRERALALMAKGRDVGGEFQDQLHDILARTADDPRIIGPVINLVLVLKSLERICHFAYHIAAHVLFEYDPEHALVMPSHEIGGPDSI